MEIEGEEVDSGIEGKEGESEKKKRKEKEKKKERAEIRSHDRQKK